jgi:Cellulase (glycosyl hydrolase family 5)
VAATLAKTGSRRLRGARTSAWLGTLALLVGLWPLLGPAEPAAAYGTGCNHPVVLPVGPFKIASDNRTIKDANGRTFISYGTTVPGLSSPTFSTDPNFVTNVVKGKDFPKIDATANVWCGNTVRLQVSQYNVTQNTTQDGGGCNASFLNQALDPEVKQAEADGLVVVVNDQTESDSAAVSGLAAKEQDPTKATFAFWNCVTQHHESWGASQTYAQDEQVIFDIFNEPRADACPADHGPNGSYDMNLWRNGGVSDGICGPAVSYQGMDAVAYHIRVSDNATNLLWVEGPGFGNSLAGLETGNCGLTSGGCLITASLGPIVYSIHHPFADASTPANSATWWKEFGYLIDHPASTGVAPVVAGEWTNFAASAANPHPYCWLDAPTSVPNFLSYLQTLGVGLSAYQLSGPTAGYLLKVNQAWTDTTNYTDATWTSGFCNYPDGTQTIPLLGAGSLIRAWFQSQD